MWILELKLRVLSFVQLLINHHDEAMTAHPPWRRISLHCFKFQLFEIFIDTRISVILYKNVKYTIFVDAHVGISKFHKVMDGEIWSDHWIQRQQQQQTKNSCTDLRT